MEAYFDKAKGTDNKLGNWHVYDANRDPAQPQGRVLFLDSTGNGLGGDDDLDSGGRFVGVAPEAPSARGGGAS